MPSLWASVYVYAYMVCVCMPIWCVCVCVMYVWCARCVVCDHMVARQNQVLMITEQDFLVHYL